MIGSRTSMTSVFFVSSRRRHTRFDCDWSSDVCSSDLLHRVLAGDSLDAHAYDTISGGDWLSDQDAVEAFVREAPQEMLRLEHWGCPWSREPDGHIAVRPFGGMKIERTWFAADKTGFHMLHTLFQTTLKYDAIE